MDQRISPESDMILVTSQIRSEERAILGALEERGRRVEVLDPRRPWLSEHLGSGAGRPVLNREIAATRAAYAASMLEDAGYRVVNSADAAWLCSDKWRTYLALREAGLPTPRTTVALTPELVPELVADFGDSAVVKPITGSWGRRVTRVQDPGTAAVLAEYAAALSTPQARMLCVQEEIHKPDRDIRVVVVGGRALGAIYRSGGWRTNVAVGATTTHCRLTASLEKLAVRAAECVGAEIAGVDLVEGEAGRLYVLEVNSRVEFAGFGSVHGQECVSAAIADLMDTVAAQLGGEVRQ